MELCLSRPGVSCSRNRAATARGLIARSRPSSARSNATARRSTSASRSCTTRTWSGRSRNAARSSSRRPRRCPEGAVVVFSAHGVAPDVHAEAQRPRPAHDRRDLPAGDEGAQRGAPVRRRGLRHPADRPRGSRGGRRHYRRGARAHQAGRRPGGCRQDRGRAIRRRWPGCPRPRCRWTRPTQTVSGAARAVPAADRPAERRHLLRDAEPAGRGQADRPASPTC